MNLSEIPNLHKSLSESLAKFGMSHLLPKLTAGVKQKITVKNARHKSRFTLSMWDFMTVKTEKGWMLIPLEAGTYDFDIGECLPGAKFPLELRIVEIRLDGSPAKWKQIMDVPVN